MKSTIRRPRRFDLLAAVKGVAAQTGKEAAIWLFALKQTLAVLLAMWVSLRFELGQPSTAMVTVYVLMHPQSGMVLTKSAYRILGTLFGAAACLVLFALFPQQRVLFLLGLSLWVGFCTAGAALNRNFRCYGFTLAGYTAAMVGLSLVNHPMSFFAYASNRISEVAVGILCAGLVGDLIFPQHLGSTIVRSVQSRYTEFCGFVQALFTGKMSPRDVEGTHLRFIHSVLTLESLRGASLLETTQTPRGDARLRRMNRDFMAASTTLHSIDQLMKRLQKAESPAAPGLVLLAESLAEALLNDGEPARTEAEAHRSSRRIAAYNATLDERVAALHHDLGTPPDSPTTLDFVTGVELIRRLAQEIQDYTGAYAAGPEEHSPLGSEDLHFASRTDPAVAILNGIRAMLTLFLISMFWIGTSWQYGNVAVMSVAIGCSLFAPAPDPTKALTGGLIGHALGFPAAFICKFLILPHLSGFGMLCAVLVPFLLVGSWLAMSPKTANYSLAYSVMVCFMIAPSNSMQYDPMYMLNFGNALMLGLAAAAVMFAIFIPPTGSWFKHRIPKMLRRQVLKVCSAPLSGLEHRFESGTRDLLQKIAAGQSAQNSPDQNALDWMFLALETGRAVIHLRQAAQNMSQQLRLKEVDESIALIQQLFRRPTGGNHAAAITGVENAIDAIRSQQNRETAGHLLDGDLHQMTTSLHFIRIALLDDETALAASTNGPAPRHRGEISYAA
ncbi:membrane transport protein, FUSC family, putative [Syntrophotalea carbinolica DSM 2380]|uniref:Membrane transport protein, FUSC family, putative n=1 Tax=Syntrophotalea carbinolica (strain DSM 2380 / NBRC 103641 / GraBd1) TaxID=338963 RepID=Q3A0G1_SYNC1|nr:FUSC family protein [Syntrophotalea carbinolica]ABA90146.1 membrane transport protein, FUSC family, putative [Syntrophotalea carbinolica DSM 2380]